MTKQEAIKAMSEGKKVTHRFFEKDEYVKMREFGSVAQTDPSIYWLSGKYQVSATMFWNDRSGQHWETDWSIWSSQ
jgi:hypothetical protein